MTAHIQQLADQQDASDKLAAFGKAVLLAHRGIGGPFDIDGGDLQDMAEKAGVLELRTVTESCGERCDCVSIGLPARCYFVPDAVKELLED
jgi:hypothetical protein